MKREGVIAGALWAVLTLVGEALAWNAPILPARYSETADASDKAFLILVRLAIPVFAFVVAVLVVSVVRFRSRGTPTEDGPPVRGTRRVYLLWLGVTGLLAHLLIVYPGLTGLAELHAAGNHGPEDLVVRLEAARWAWKVTYPEGGITSGEEMVLPLDQRIKFEVTSVDVLHSFWIPAFRIKIDAVPGRTTEASVTPERAGSFSEDPNLRIQCAELCGLGHAAMALPIRVVGAVEFDAWLGELKAAQQAGPACDPAGTELQVVAEKIAFDTTCLAAPADAPFTVSLENRDAGVPHNLSIYTDETAKEVLFKGELFNGVDARTYEVPALPAGTYFFRCDVHPIPAMSGTFVVA